MYIWCNEYWWLSCQRHVQSPVTNPSYIYLGVESRPEWRWGETRDDEGWSGLVRIIITSLTLVMNIMTSWTGQLNTELHSWSQCHLISISDPEMTERFESVVSSKYHDSRPDETLSRLRLRLKYFHLVINITGHQYNHLTKSVVKTMKVTYNLDPGHLKTQDR